MALSRSTKAGTPAHSHAILELPDGSAVTSENDGHAHKIVPREAPLPMPGAPPQAMGMGWTEGPGGHVHDILPETPESEKANEKPTEDETIVVGEVIRLFQTARSGEDECRKMANESEDFYAGKQWDEKVKKDLESADRAALTMNEIEPKIDLLSGYQRQNRSDIKYLPVEEGDQRVVDILNTVVTNILDQSNFEHEETNVFEDGMITGRGFFHAYVDYDKNPLGDIVVEQFPQSDVYLGPHKRVDCKDLEYLCKAQWFSEAKMKQMFPKKADSIARNMAEVMGLRTTPMETQEKPDAYDAGFNAGEGVPAPLSIAPDPLMVDIGRKEFLLVECWRKEYDTEQVAVLGDETRSLKDWEEGEIAGAKQLAKIVEKRIDRLRVTLVAGTVMLSDEYNDLYGESFPLTAFYAKRRNGKYWGKIESAKDPQREINKRHSQIVDILNKAAAYGWFYDASTFPDQQAEKKFKDNAGTPGFTLKVTDINRVPLQIEGIKFPNEISALEEISTTKLREIMNINPELLGIDSKSESGLAQIEKKRQGLIGNEFLFDNLNLCKKQLGRTIIRLMQKVYTPERIMRVLTGQASKNPQMMVGGQPMTQDRSQEIITLLSTTDLAKYDVAVSESAHSPTQRRANFAAWADLAGKGIQVPPSLLVQLSDLEDKDTVLAAMEAQAKAQMDLENRKIDAEIEKTKIATMNQPSPAKGFPQ